MKSIQQRLTKSLLLSFGILLTACGVAVFYLTRLGLLYEFDAGLRAKAMVMASLAQQDSHGLKFDLSDSFYQIESDIGAPRWFELWQTNGVVCGRSKFLRDADLPFHFGTQVSPEFWTLELPDGRPGRAIGYKFLPVIEDEEKQGFTPTPAILVVAADSTSVNRALLAFGAVLMATGMATLLITTPIVRACLFRGHAPLNDLTAKAATITADSLETRFAVDTLPAELKPIAGRLNDLLGRLQKSFERERQFSSDIAHELRTPLAELRSLAEVELAWPEGRSSGRARETLEIALQMEQIMTRLLELLRCENGQIQLKKESVNIPALVKEIWDAQSRKASGKQLGFQLNMPPDASIQTDRALFRAIVGNLLSNAVEYTPTGGRVEVSWKVSGQGMEIQFANSVDDLTAGDLPHLFERLWRKDKSRGGGEHFGLGLAISQSYAEILGYQLRAELTAKNLLTVSLVSI